MLYNNVGDIDPKKINLRIKEAIKQWGSQDDFFDGIPYSKQSFHKCVRDKTIPPLSVLLEIAKKLNCDIGYLLCEYDEKHHAVADVKKETGLEPDVINIILNMKNSFLKVSLLNDLLRDDYFLAIIDLLHIADYHYKKCAEVEAEAKIASNCKNDKTPEEMEKLQKLCETYTNEHALHKAKALAYRYRLTVAFSRLLDTRYGPLPDIDTLSLESKWKQENHIHSQPIIF